MQVQFSLLTVRKCNAKLPTLPATHDSNKWKEESRREATIPFKWIARRRSMGDWANASKLSGAMRAESKTSVESEN